MTGQFREKLWSIQGFEAVNQREITETELICE